MITEDEDRIEGALYDRDYDDHIAKVTEPDVKVCRTCGRTAPLIGHICEECHRYILEPKL